MKKCTFLPVTVLPCVTKISVTFYMQSCRLVSSYLDKYIFSWLLVSFLFIEPYSMSRFVETCKQVMNEKLSAIFV